MRGEPLADRDSVRDKDSSVVAETIRWFQADDTLAGLVLARISPALRRGSVMAFTAEEGGISECR
jgi:hypothetical protein